MTSEEIIGYVNSTPENSNPNVLRDMLEQLNTGSNDAINITYTDLKFLKDNSQLVPGTYYRIIDYVTKINGTYDLSAEVGDTAWFPYARSVEHPFDLVVKALSVDILDENASAIQHSGDIYFSDSKLSAWKIKYTIDNDAVMYAWADTINGKGVIYYMKDEFNNEAGYDFKNI